MATISRDRPGPKAVVTERSGGALALPSQENIPPSDLSESIVFLYGRKGIGKTSLASQFEKSLTFMFERGRRNLAIRQVPQKGDPKLDWELFLSYVELALDSDSVNTLVIDTIDRAYEQCMHYVCRRSGCKHPNDKNDYGKTWQEVKQEFDATLGVIQDSGKGLVLLSHETAKPLTKTSRRLEREDSESTCQYDRMEPTCSKQAFETVQEICDYVLYYGYSDEYRTITVRSPNDTCWTSCGISDTFLDPEGSPIQSFKVGNDAKEAYKNLIAAHGNEVYDVNYKPPKEKKNKVNI